MIDFKLCAQSIHYVNIEAFAIVGYDVLRHPMSTDDFCFSTRWVICIFVKFVTEANFIHW